VFDEMENKIQEIIKLVLELEVVSKMNVNKKFKIINMLNNLGRNQNKKLKRL